jgi:hypothetical protein
MRCLMLLCAFVLALPACGDDDDPGSEAQRRGVGAACSSDAECPESASSCLAFKGGYCGLMGCTANENCPSGSACVRHDDGLNYCFLICRDKPQCNLYRPGVEEANCSASVSFVESTAAKACVPPS